MKFKKLVLQNFGVYKGIHSFDLTTYEKSNGDDENVVIFKGANGSGKTTIFTAISLALFGKLALGDKISKRDYQDYLLGKFHKSRFTDSTYRSEKASVLIIFDYVESGIRHEIKVERIWHRNGEDVREELNVLKDDSQPEVEEMDYQTWLRDICPPGLLNLICFNFSCSESV
jgi:DNA sulfur modification protein DndD